MKTIISWNVQNIVTVFLMVSLVALAYCAVTGGVKKIVDKMKVSAPDDS